LLLLFSFCSTLVHARRRTEGKKSSDLIRGGKNAAATKDDGGNNNEKKKKTNNNNNNIIIRVVGIVKQADENSRSSFPCRARVSLVVIVVVVVIINTIVIIYDGRGEKVDRKAVKERDERKLLGESPATVFVGRNESAGHFGVR
jgi:hypothetical protein